MTYLVDDIKYHFSYPELETFYLQFKDLSDEEFLNSLTKIIHFCCFVSYLKELPNECTISDLGLIHELIHLKLCIEDSFMPESKIELLKKVRHQFNYLMQL